MRRKFIVFFITLSLITLCLFGCGSESDKNTYSEKTNQPEIITSDANDSNIPTEEENEPEIQEVLESDKNTSSSDSSKNIEKAELGLDISVEEYIDRLNIYLDSVANSEAVNVPVEEIDESEAVCYSFFHEDEKTPIGMIINQKS